MNVAPHPRPSDSVNIISLCTGGGGLDLGVELALPAARSVCLVERETFAVARLVEAMRQGLMAPAAVWSDARTFDGRPWRGAVDGVIGGIPCQPHSVAGKRLGSDDERDLWSPARRIIVQSGAWFVLIENVPGMLTAKPGLDPGALRVRRDLYRLGFDVEAGLFSAAEVGASHERERLFILGVADARCPRPQGCERCGASGEWVRTAAPRPTAELCGASLGDALREGSHASAYAGIYSRGDKTKPDADADRASLFPPSPGDLDDWRAVLARTPELEPAVRRMADGMASRVDELRMLGNGVVPLEGAHAFRTLVARLAARGSAGAAFLERGMVT